ncbi:MAG: signal peptide peptidase SppA [Pseudomonadota bacterium]
MDANKPAGGAAQRDELAASVAAIAASMDRTREDQARERRRVWWRTWLFRGVIILLVIFGAVGASVNEDVVVAGDHIARFTVEGVITDDPQRDALLAKIAEEDRVKALIVRINSPGGTTTGGEALYESLRRVAERKPVVAVMGEVAASAGYIVALASDHMIARGNSLTGSIGVIFTAPNVHGLLENIGVSVIELKSGERKAEPSPYKPVDPSALTFEAELIQDSFDWFIGLVKERRAPSAETLAEISDGRVLTGRMAAEAGLVDALGGEKDAIEWLSAEREVDTSLPVLEREVPPEDPSLVESLFGSSAGALLGLAGDGFAARVGLALEGPALLSVAR